MGAYGFIKRRIESVMKEINFKQNRREERYSKEERNRQEETNLKETEKT